MDNYEELLNEIMKDIDEKKLKRKSERELNKFRKNISNVIRKIFTLPTVKKVEVIQLFQIASFELISQIPVVTPIITAMLQVITGTDLGSKIDNLGSKIDNLSSKIDNLSSKIDNLSSKIDNLGNKMDNLNNKMDNLNNKMDNLNNKMDNLGNKMDNMLELQQKTISILEEIRERLPHPK